MAPPTFLLAPVLAAVLLARPCASTDNTCHGCASRSGFAAGDGHLQHSVEPSAIHCCDACGKVPACKLWEYSESSRSCWLKDNDKHMAPQADRTIGSCATDPLPPPSPPGPPGPSPPGPPAPAPAPPTNVSVQLNLAGGGKAGAHTALPEFVSFCLDWWHPDEGCSPEGCELESDSDTPAPSHTFAPTL